MPKIWQAWRKYGILAAWQASKKSKNRKRITSKSVTLPSASIELPGGDDAYYQVAGRTPDGKRKMQSFGTLEAAKKETDRVARAISAGQVEAECFKEAFVS